MNEVTKAASGQIAKPFPRVWQAIVAIILFFALQGLGGILAAVAVIASQADNVQEMQQMTGRLADMKLMAEPIMWGLVGSTTVSLALLWLVLRKRERAAAVHLDRWSQLPLSQTIIWAVVLIGAGLAFNAAYSEFVVPHIKMQDATRQIFASIPDTLLNSVMLFLTVAVLAPIAEELIFRGLLQTSLKHHMKGHWAIIIASLVFAAIHVDYYAFPALLTLGLVFGFLYEKTGSLRVNIILHIINNAAALLLTQ